MTAPSCRPRRAISARRAQLSGRSHRIRPGSEVLTGEPADQLGAVPAAVEIWDTCPVEADRDPSPTDGSAGRRQPNPQDPALRECAARRKRVVAEEVPSEYAIRRPR